MMRVSSPMDVPGAVTQCIRKSRSLKSGRSDWPSCGHTPSPTMLTRPTVTKAGRVVRRMREISAGVAVLQSLGDG